MSSLKLSRLLTFLLFILLVSSLPGKASFEKNDRSTDTLSYIIIDKIIIIGNKKTKEKIILRELNFKSGDTILTTSIPDIISRSRNRIFNTNLFITVELALVERGYNVKDLLIHVKERWYIYPIPIFELADRNFNEWWQQRKRDPKRINLGIFYTQRNMRGRNETLRAKIQFGFTKKFELFYIVPYINKNQKTGLSFDISYIINKQIPYKTSDHKLVYFDGNDFIRNKFRTGVLFSHRKKFYQTHLAGISFNYNTIADTITKLNPQYLLRAQTVQRYFSLRYGFINDLRDIAFYPLRGSYFRAEAEGMGMGIFNDINQLNLVGEYSLFRNIGKKFFIAGGLRQKISFPIHQAYLNVRALGYDKDYVSGYELYVIDGQHFSLAKINFKWQLYSTKKTITAIPSTQFESIPFAIYLKMYSDAGYVRDNSFNPENVLLSNEFLLGGGIGVDFVSYYDFVLRVEYSINRMKEHQLFLHLRAGI